MTTLAPVASVMEYFTIEQVRRQDARAAATSMDLERLLGFTGLTQYALERVVLHAVDEECGEVRRLEHAQGGSIVVAASLEFSASAKRENLTSILGAAMAKMGALLYGLSMVPPRWKPPLRAPCRERARAAPRTLHAWPRRRPSPSA